MLISQAYAAAAENSDALAGIAGAPTPAEALMWNLGLVVVLVALFYVLLIMPQQKRFKEHSDMLNDLKKGDRVVTNGGLVGKIDKILDKKEVVIDLGNNIKVTALRSMIQGKTELKPKLAANDLPSTKDKAKAKDDKKPSKTSKSSKDTKTTKDKKKV